MKPELVRDLHGARDTITELDRILSRNKYRGDFGTVLTVGLINTMIQYHHSVVLSINSGSSRAALGLARELVRCMYTALG